MPQILDAALAYARFGWRVLPVRGGAKEPPLIASWQNEASCAPATVRRWWQQWPSANVAIATGAASGLVVIDVDPRHGGDKSAAELERKHGATPTLTARTGGGGLHFYFAHPGRVVKNRAGLLPGLDVRGDGGYVVAPPSRLSDKAGASNGGLYEWASGEPATAEIAPLPLWLLNLLQEQKDTEQTERPCWGDTEHTEHTEHTEQQIACVCSVTLSAPSCSRLLADSRIEQAIAATLPESKGVRNRRIFDLCRRLKALPLTAGLTAAELEPVLRKWHERALPNIGTRDIAESWTDFAIAWGRVRLPFGATLDGALEQAKRLPMSRIPSAVQLLGDRATLLARLCLVLGDDGQTFFLSCRDAARLVGGTHADAAKLLQALCELDFMQIVRRGNERRATRFRLCPAAAPCAGEPPRKATK